MDHSFLFPSHSQDSNDNHSVQQHDKSTETKANPIFNFLRNFSINKIARHLTDQNTKSDVSLLKKIRKKANHGVQLSLYEVTPKELKKFSTQKFTENLHLLLSIRKDLKKNISYEFNKRQNQTDLYLSDKTPQNTSSLIENLQQITNNQSQNFLLGELNEKFVQNLCSQSLNFAKQWDIIRPSSRYFILFNFYVHQVYKLQTINNLFTLNVENLEETLKCFHDLTYFPFTIAFIMIHKIYPSCLSEIMIEFLVCCFEKTRQSIQECIEFDDEFRIEFNSFSKFKISNCFKNFNFNDFMTVFQNVTKKILSQLDFSVQSQHNFALLSARFDFVEFIKNLDWLATKNCFFVEL